MAKTKAKKSRVTKKKVVEEAPYIPKRYEVNIFRKLEPAARDSVVARFGYWESTNELKLLEYKDGSGADVEGMLERDITLVDGTGVSVHNDPKNWIKNLCNTKWRNLKTAKYYASAAREYDETE